MRRMTEDPRERPAWWLCLAALAVALALLFMDPIISHFTGGRW